MIAKPLVGIITNETVGFNGRQIAHSTGKRYVDSVMQFAGVMPILIPTCITTQDVGALLDHLDGIVFLDHLSSLKRNMILRKMIKAKKSRNRDAAA